MVCCSQLAQRELTESNTVTQARDLLQLLGTHVLEHPTLLPYPMDQRGRAAGTRFGGALVGLLHVAVAHGHFDLEVDLAPVPGKGAGRYALADKALVLRRRRLGTGLTGEREYTVAQVCLQVKGWFPVG
jgi:hypothetical protein